MTTVTIPKELAKQGDLVLVPKKEYEELLGWRRAVKSSKKKKQTALDRSLAIALQEVREGKLSGPFDTVKDLMKSLESGS